ncbi:response regulator [Pacificoceanicola onchidii]|uniref:response regulator n=1 Tax=Pacificoceanicola onchidii TaxID=2562685 RepID=UPI0010A54BD5|nr:response regulator [Pacificoceanicola onchidii]
MIGAGQQNGPPLNILLVEDDDGDAKAVSRAVAKCCLPVVLTRALDGIEALELMRDASGPLPARYLVLADLNMPRMNGIEFLAALRGDPRLRETVVFVMTTSQSEEDRRAAYAHSVAGYAPKDGLGDGLEHLARFLEAYARIIELPMLQP